MTDNPKMTKPGPVDPRDIDISDPRLLRVIWAAMTAMVHDIHAPQDGLSKTEWRVAEDFMNYLDKVMNDAG